ncbi:MAG: hypothetical protein QOH54_2812 [Mycobacterium sp.]|nr:hypothetical protein [Mycobacterium sp.]
MHLISVTVADVPPIERFEIDGLTDTVVIAGPNGVGKTRLMQRMVQLLRGDETSPTATVRVDATSDVERQAWGKKTLDLVLQP